MTNYLNDAAVIQYSVFDAVEMIPDAELRALTYKTLILNALNDEFILTGNPLSDMVLTMAKPTQVSTAQRYEKARENGKLGGRPVEYDKNTILDLRAKNYTQNQIAAAVGCSISEVKNVLREARSKTDINLEREIETEKEMETKPKIKEEFEKEDKREMKTYMELNTEPEIPENNEEIEAMLAEDRKVPRTEYDYDMEIQRQVLEEIALWQEQDAREKKVAEIRKRRKQVKADYM